MQGGSARSQPGRSMTWLTRASVRHPRLTLLATFVVVLCVAPGVLRLRLRTDGGSLVPTGDARVRVDREIREQFAIEDPVVVVVEADGPSGIYDRRTLTLIRELTDEFLGLDGVSATNVVSLATEKVDRLHEGSLRFRSVLDPFPRDDEEVLQTRADVRAIELYTGTLVSSDERAAALYVGVPEEVDRDDFCRSIGRIAARHAAGSGQIHVIGAPVAETFLGSHLLADLGVPPSLLGRHSADEAQEGTALAHPSPLRNLGLVQFALALVTIVFWVSFRSLRLALLALTEVGCCLLLVFGLMGWCGVPVYLTIAVLPIMLTVMGLADEVHIFACYRRRLRGGPVGPRAEVVKSTMDEMWRPLVKTTATTAIGFLSFAISPIAPVRWFGIFAAAGIVLFGLWSLTALPASLVLFGPGGSALEGRLSSRAGREPLVARFAARVIRRPWVTILATAVVVALALIGVRRVEVQDSWVRNFDTNSEFYRATQRFNAGFFGAHRLLVRWSSPDYLLTGSLSAKDLEHTRALVPGDLVEDPAVLVGARLELTPGGKPREPTGDTQGDAREEAPLNRISDFVVDAQREGERIVLTTTGEGGSLFGFLSLSRRKSATFEISPQPLRDPRVLRQISELEAFLRSQRDCAVGGVLGPTDYLSTANFMQQRRVEGSRTVPDDAHEVVRVWNNVGAIRGVDRRLQVVDPTYSRGLVVMFLKNANFADTKLLLHRIRAYADANLAAQGIELDFAGDVAVSQALIEAIVSTQIRSVALCLIGIAVLVSILGRSIVWGLLCVLPSTIAVLVVLASMGVLGVPLGVATSMFAAMTIGVGVDYAIHLLERLHRNRADGLRRDPALADAVRVTGPAIGVDACAVVLGFGVLAFSHVPANARLGGILVVSMTACLVVTLVLLPALLSLSPTGGASR